MSYQVAVVLQWEGTQLVALLIVALRCSSRVVVQIVGLAVQVVIAVQVVVVIAVIAVRVIVIAVQVIVIAVVAA